MSNSILPDAGVYDVPYLRVVGEDRSYTRRDILRYADLIAQDLPANEGNLIVGVQHQHPFNFLSTIIACWSKGLGITPLAMDLPDSHLKQLGEYNVCLVLSESPIENCPVPNQVIPAPDPSCSGQEGVITDAISPQSVAVVIFTSGSTGKPKAIPLSIDNIRSNITAMTAHLNCAQDINYICTSPLFYAHGLYNSLLTSYFSGNPVTFIYPLDAFSCTKLIKHLASSETRNLWHMTPSMVKIFLHTIKRKKKLIEQLNLDTLIIGTSPLPELDKNELLSLIPCEIYQQYGMSECLLISCNDGTNDCSLGRVLTGEIEIRNKSGNNAGEVWVKSPSGFGSYYNQPEYNTAYDRNGWFKTGDLGYLDENDKLFLTGRASRMVKKGGITVYPEHIEEALNKHQGVTDAIVAGYKDERYGENLNAFVLTADKDLDEHALREHCLAYIAENQLPEKFIFIDSVPKLPNGKVDLKYFETYEP